ncbi:MAG: zinc-binding dehydrogenase, partial [Bacteroidales bacterium]|nr:zinc-binding dehydrogenase [Bacteroidales bacterium]
MGAKWAGQFKPGDKFSIQPALNYEDGPVGILSAPGYSYKFIGGDATYVIIPSEVMEQDCLLPYNGEGYYPASLAEPLSCVIGAMHANYHTTQGSYIHKMEIVQGGNMAILAGVGPMGLAAINFAINRKDRQPGLLVVTDIDQIRLDRAASLYTVEQAAKNNIKLVYMNTKDCDDPEAELMKLTDGKGYDDVFVFAPVPALIEQADNILGQDGCLNFFAGPADPEFSAKMNFYRVHYQFTHIVGTSGGNNDDMQEALEYFNEGLDPAGLVTHIGGINAVIETTLNLPEIPGGKKLIYNHIEMPLTPTSQFGELGKTNPVYAKLDEICNNHKGLWNVEA